ncbi:MAG: class II aldolase/adducin family protein [Thermodesulfovibrionales bacterium]|nr:class II aldolase/adducin family protein [Thermodesulfovibrionales bacterium]
MERLIYKYLNKLQRQGLSELNETLIIAYDDKPYSNSEDFFKYEDVFNWLNINTLIVSIPAEPYRTIIKEIVNNYNDNHSIKPADCETRTFFHDIPIIENDSIYDIVTALSRRKSAITREGQIITYGTISPEQAYVSLSSVCFSLFIKYLYDVVQYKKNYCSIDKVLSFCKELDESHCNIKADNQLDATIAAGKLVVNLGLVDSYFGNISCFLDNKIYISQTGSSLDELEDAIDIVPIDGSSTNAITASSEFTAHRLIYEKTDFKYILHGHPKFSVIMSMCCDRNDCRGDDCYRSCKVYRKIANAEIVSGEIGTGKWGLNNTVPEAMTKSDIVIVYGHGVFSPSKEGFDECLRKMVELENYCMREYKKIVGFY